MKTLLLLALLLPSPASAQTLQEMKVGQCVGFLNFHVHAKLRKGVYEIRSFSERGVLSTKRKLKEGEVFSVLQYAGETEVLKENGFTDTAPLWKECP